MAEDGEVLAFRPDGARREARVEAGRILLDRGSATEVEDVVVRDRRHLSAEGIVVPVVVVDRQTGRLESAPEIVTRGFVDGEEGASLIDEAELALAQTMEAPARARSGAIPRSRASGCGSSCGASSASATQRRPMVIPVVMEV